MLSSISRYPLTMTRVSKVQTAGAALLFLAVACGGSTATGGGQDASTGDGASSSGGDGATSSGGGDGGAGGDGLACVNVDLGTYDRSCKADPDCTIITAGQYCPNICTCGNATINVAGEGRYRAQIAGIPTTACPCAFPGTPRCVQGTCTICTFGPGSPAGCPDGG
jgi:hypothetical protein